MKPQMKFLPVYASVAVLLLSACAQLQSGADPVVVRAEQITASAYDTMETFKKYEFDNRATLEALNPKIETYANVIRRNGKRWLQTARSETMAYKNNRTSENKANMNTAIAVLQEAIHQIGLYMAQAGASH